MTHHLQPGLITDARHVISHGCPMDVDLLPVDQQVEIVIGAQRGPGESVRLAFDHPDVLQELASAAIRGRDMLAHVSKGDAALSRLDTGDTFGFFATGAP